MNPSLTKKENKNRRRAKIFVGFLVSTSILGGISLVPIYDGKNIVFAASQMGSELPTLQTGEKIDSATHDYNSADISNGDSWTTAGTASPTSPNQLFSTTLVNNSLSSAGFALFKGTLDMTKPVSFSGNFQIQGTSLEVGDSLGFILTPLDVSSIQNGQTGSRLGLGGLANSTFLGRDLYYNTGGSGDIFDENPTNAWFSGASNAVVIRSTDRTGNLEYSDGKTGSYPVASAPDKGVDGNINETMGFEWTPTATDPSGVTGILKYTLIPADGSPSVSLEKTMTVASSLSLGVIGATGGNTGVLTYSNNGSTFTASKGTAEVTVNYLDKNTGDKLAEPSTIVANVGDTVNILNSSSQITTTSNYDENYGAPKISGYDYVSATPLEVANNSSNNVINIYYQTQKYTTVNKDDHGNTLSSTDGYKLISTTQNSSSEIVDNVSVTNNITTNIWHKPVNTIVNQDDTGTPLTDISGLKLMSSTTSTPDATTGDTTTTIIWHKPVNTIVNQDDTGTPLTETSGLKSVSSTTSTPDATTGDTTTTVIWHKPVTINTSKIVNLDENGNELTDTEGYVHSEQIRTPMVTSSVALNGDITNLTTNYLIWHKVVTTTVNVNKNIDESGQIITSTNGYKLIKTNPPILTPVTAANGDITITSTTTYIWHKMTESTTTTTINVDENDKEISDTAGCVPSHESKQPQITTNTAPNGDVTTTITNFIVWHKVITTVVTINKNVDESGQEIADTSTYKLLKAGNPIFTRKVDLNGDITVTSTTVNIWHKPTITNTSRTINLDENSNELTDMKGYVPSEQTKASTVTSITSQNGDITNLTTNYLIWHKVVTKTVNVIRNIDENGKELLNTKGYDKVSQSEKSAHSTAENGDITVTKTLTIQWNKQNLPQKITQSIDKKVEIPSSEAQPAQQTPASSSTQTVGAGPQKSVKKTSQSTKSSKANSPQKRTTPKSSEPSSAVKVEKQTKVQKVKNSAHLNSKPEMTEHQKLMKVLKVESAGAGGAIGGMVISGVLWTLIQKFLPAGLFAFIIGGKRRKKKDEEDK